MTDSRVSKIIMLLLLLLILSLSLEAAWHKLLSWVCKPIAISDNKIISSANNRINNSTKRTETYTLLSIVDILQG